MGLFAWELGGGIRIHTWENLFNHFLKSLPAAGRCVIERSQSSFSALSKESLDKFHGVKFLQIVDSFAHANIPDRNF